RFRNREVSRGGHPHRAPRHPRLRRCQARRPRVERCPVVPHPPPAVVKFPVAPMKATMPSLPPDDGWAFEVKWDGYRTIVHIAAGTVRLQSTAGHHVEAAWAGVRGVSATGAHSDT